MSTEVFDSLNGNWQLYRDVDISLKQLENKEVKDGQEVLNSIRSKYGL